MIGVPVNVLRDGEMTKIYLSTRRSGEVGQAMLDLKRNLRSLDLKRAKLYKAFAIITKKVDDLVDDSADAKIDDAALAELSADHDKRMKQLTDLDQEYNDLAYKLVELAVHDNHGDDAQAIMDNLTTKQINQCVNIIETGDVPKDFFPQSVIRQNESST